MPGRYQGVRPQQPLLRGQTPGRGLPGQGPGPGTRSWGTTASAVRADQLLLAGIDGVRPQDVPFQDRSRARPPGRYRRGLPTGSDPRTRPFRTGLSSRAPVLANEMCRGRPPQPPERISFFSQPTGSDPRTCPPRTGPGAGTRPGPCRRQRPAPSGDSARHRRAPARHVRRPRAPSSRQRDELLRHRRQHLGAVLADDDEVLDPNAPETG